jgi:hypothetical protein
MKGDVHLFGASYGIPKVCMIFLSTLIVIHQFKICSFRL